jgi:DNA replication protein DnaC
VEYVPCEKCTSLGTPGFIFRNGESFPCECKKENHAETIKEYKILSSGMPSYCASYDFSSYRIKKENSPFDLLSELLTDIKGIVNRSEKLYFYGESNTQKTSIGCFFIKKALEQNIKSCYTSMPYLFSNLVSASSFSYNEAKETSVSRINKWRNSSLLCIDDSFDTGKLYLSGKTNYNSVLLLQFVDDYISRLNKGLIIISRNSMSKIPWATKDGEGFDRAFRGTLERFKEIEFVDKLNISEMVSR